MSDIGYDVQFTVRYVAGGCYDIRLTSNSKYLTRSSTASNKNVVLQSSVDMTYSLWNIETNTHEGYTYHYFKNASTDEYLTWQNGTLKVVSTIGDEGTEAFYACSWRVANPSSGVFRELTSVTIDDMWLPCRLWEAPTVHAYPSDADMCAPFDFTYTFDTAYVEADTLTGCIRPIYAYGCCTKTITATHKPTGITTTFSLTMNPKGIMLALNSGNGDNHSSSLSYAISQLTACNYTGGYLVNSPLTVSEVNAYMDDPGVNKNSILVMRGEGSVKESATSTFLGTQMKISDDEWYSSVDMASANIDLSNLRIAVFAGNHTAAGNATSSNLLTVAVDKGAKVAIGFKEAAADCAMINRWVELFFDELVSGKTVEEAIDGVDTYWYGDYCYTSLDVETAGDTTITLWQPYS